MIKYFIFFILFIANLLNYADRYILSGVLTQVSTDISLTPTEMGICGSGFMFAYLIFALIFGLFIKKNHLFFLGLSIIYWSIAVFMTSYAYDFNSLLLPRVVTGIGESCFVIVAPVMIYKLFGEKKLAALYGLFYLAIPLGAALGYKFSGVFTKYYSWRDAFKIPAYIGVFVGVIVILLCFMKRKEEKFSETKVNQLGLIRNKIYLMNALGMALMTFAIGGFGYWAQEFMVKVKNFDMNIASERFGEILFLAGVIGSFLGGYLSDSLKQKIKGSHLIISSMGMILGSIIAFFSIFTFTGSMFLFSAFVVIFFVFLNSGPTNAVIAETSGLKSCTFAFGLNTFIIHILGDVPSPVIIGRLSEVIDKVDKPKSFTLAMICIPVTMFLSGVFFFVGSRFYRKK